jgi:hypothetical protein
MGAKGDEGGRLQSVFGQKLGFTPAGLTDAPHSTYLAYRGYDEFGTVKRNIAGNLSQTNYAYQPLSPLRLKEPAAKLRRFALEELLQTVSNGKHSRVEVANSAASQPGRARSVREKAPRISDERVGTNSQFELPTGLVPGCAPRGSQRDRGGTENEL